MLVCLKAAADFDCSELIVHSDSELMVRQLNGQYKIRNENLKKYFQQAQAILRTAEYRAAFRHVVREQNSEADALANRGIDQKIPLTRQIFGFERKNRVCLKKAGDYPEAVRGASGSRSVPPQAGRGGKSEHHRARRPVLNGGLPGNIPEERNVSQKRYIPEIPKGSSGKR